MRCSICANNLHRFHGGSSPFSHPQTIQDEGTAWGVEFGDKEITCQKKLSCGTHMFDCFFFYRMWGHHLIYGTVWTIRRWFENIFPICCENAFGSLLPIAKMSPVRKRIRQNHPNSQQIILRSTTMLIVDCKPIPMSDRVAAALPLLRWNVIASWFIWDTRLCLWMKNASQR